MTVNYMTAVEQNAKLRNVLEWTADELGIVEAMKADELVSHIAAMQQQLGVPVDGVLGPKTYSAIVADRRAHLFATLAPLAPAEWLVAVGKLAVMNGRLTWLRDIQDGKPGAFPEESRAWIDAIIRTAAGVNWTWMKPYQGDGEYEWCTTYVANCYAGNAGHAMVNLSDRTNFFSSTDRLDHYGRYEQALNHPAPKPATGPFRMMIELDEHSKPSDAVFPDGTLPREGDIGMAGGVHTGPGKHGFLITGWDPVLGVAKTLEGNARGLGPTGAIRQGVIRATRRVGLPPGAAETTYHLRRILRLGYSEFVR